MVVSILALAMFLYIEASPEWVPEPIIPVILIAKSKTILCACLTNWFASMASFLALYFVPLYLQSVRGYTSSQAGLRVIPFAVLTSAGSLFTGYIMRASGRYYWLMLGTMTIYFVGAALLCILNKNTPSWQTYAVISPLGFGYGGMLTITLIAMISAADHEYQAIISAASYAFRSTGSTIGLTIGSVIFQNILTSELRNEYGQLPGADKEIDKIRNSLDGLKQGYRLPTGWSRDTVLTCYMDAIRGAFICSLILATFAGLAGLGMKEHRLHSKLDRKDSNASRSRSEA